MNHSKDLTLVILAAGMGSRYGGLKQLDPVGPHDATIMDYSVYDAKRAGFERVVFVIRPDIEQEFKDQIGARYSAHIPVDYAFQRLDSIPAGFEIPEDRKKPWGTGHANLAAADAVSGPFAVINADDFYAREAFVALANFLQAPCKTDVVGCCMVGYKLRSTLSEHGTVGRGVCRCDADGFLEDIVEMQKIERDGSRAVFTADDGSQQSLTGDEIVSMNCWGFAPSVFDLLTNEFVRFMQNHGSRPGAEFHLPGAINTLIRKGKASVKVLSCDAQWCGVTYRDDKPFVQKRIADLVAEGAYPERLWS